MAGTQRALLRPAPRGPQVPGCRGSGKGRGGTAGPSRREWHRSVIEKSRKAPLCRRQKRYICCGQTIGPLSWQPGSGAKERDGAAALLRGGSEPESSSGQHFCRRFLLSDLRRELHTPSTAQEHTPQVWIRRHHFQELPPARPCPGAPRVQTAPVPASSLVRSLPASREELESVRSTGGFFSCRCCTVWVVGAHLPCGNRDSPVGNSQACGTRVFCLEEENKRNSVIHPPCPATGHAAGSTWSATGTWGHLGSTAGGRSAAPTPWHCSRHVSSERRRDT